MKKAIQRNLPLYERYTLVSITRGNVIDGNTWVCENCGKVISNIATIKDSNLRTYLVGLDCAETLKGLKDCGEFDFEKYCFNSVVNLGKAMDQPGAVITVDEMYVRVNYLDKKGKRIYKGEPLSTVKKYFPELLKKIP